MADERSVFLVTGISAAGKSTVGRLLAERLHPSVHVKGDVFRRMVINGRRHMRSEPDPEARRQLDLRYSLGAATTDRYFDAGFNVVVQDIVMGPSVPSYVDAIASRPLHVVVLVPRVEVVRAREAARAKTAYQPDGPTPDDLDAFLRENTPRIGLWLDSSDLTAEQTVDVILARRDEALV
jgi:predicted kinase